MKNVVIVGDQFRRRKLNYGMMKSWMAKKRNKNKKRRLKLKDKEAARAFRKQKRIGEKREGVKNSESVGECEKSMESINSGTGIPWMYEKR